MTPRNRILHHAGRLGLIAIGTPTAVALSFGCISDPIAESGFKDDSADRATCDDVEAGGLVRASTSWTDATREVIRLNAWTDETIDGDFQFSTAVTVTGGALVDAYVDPNGLEIEITPDPADTAGDGTRTVVVELGWSCDAKATTRTVTITIPVDGDPSTS